MTDARPIGLLAELTHRCPLRCVYCSNPLELERKAGELDTPTWKRVFSEAAALGILQVHLSGGEPTARPDLADIVAHCRSESLYTNLITAGVLIGEKELRALSEAGLDHVQLSLQDVDAANADRIAGYPGGHARKLKFAATGGGGRPAAHHQRRDAPAEHRQQRKVRRAGGTMGAKRIELAHAQYYGWALANRSRADADASPGAGGRPADR